MRILDENQIKQKITRLAFEIAEQNYSTDEVILLGINNNGHQFVSHGYVLHQRICLEKGIFTIFKSIDHYRRSDARIQPVLSGYLWRICQ